LRAPLPIGFSQKSRHHSGPAASRRLAMMPHRASPLRDATDIAINFAKFID
jgi:hypothetical protein